jgi:hypothetical protein
MWNKQSFKLILYNIPLQVEYSSGGNSIAIATDEPIPVIYKGSQFIYARCGATSVECGVRRTEYGIRIAICLCKCQLRDVDLLK